MGTVVRSLVPRQNTPVAVQTFSKTEDRGSDYVGTVQEEEEEVNGCVGA